MIFLYFDPGIGALIIQTLIAAVAGIVLFSKNLLFKIKTFLGFAREVTRIAPKIWPRVKLKCKTLTSRARSPLGKCQTAGYKFSSLTPFRVGTKLATIFESKLCLGRDHSREDCSKAVFILYFFKTRRHKSCAK